MSTPLRTFWIVTLASVAFMSLLDPEHLLNDWRVYMLAGRARAFGGDIYDRGTLFLGPPWMAWLFSALSWTPDNSPMSTSIAYVVFGLGMVTIRDVLGPGLTHSRAVILGLCASPTLWLGQLASVLAALLLAGILFPTWGWVAMAVLVLLKPSWIVVVVAVLLGLQRYKALAGALTPFVIAMFVWRAEVPDWKLQVLRHADFVQTTSVASVQWGSLAWAPREMTWALAVFAWLTSFALGLCKHPRTTRITLVLGAMTMPWLLPYDTLALLAVLCILVWAPEVRERRSSTAP